MSTSETRASARTTEVGSIHQKLRLERAQHAGYQLVAVVRVRGVIVYLLMDPEIALFSTVNDMYPFGRAPGRMVGCARAQHRQYTILAI